MRGLLLCLLLCCGSGCTWLAGVVLPGFGECEFPLLDVEDLGPDRMFRERVRFESQEVDARYELVVVKRGDELIIVAFTGLGAQAFRAVQRGRALEIDDRMGPASPVPPRTLVSQLHKARFSFAQPDGELSAPMRISDPECGLTTTWARIEERLLPSVEGTP